MPKTKLQELVFTILMVFVMVYAMICYNISLNIGGMSNAVFLMAFFWQIFFAGPMVRAIFGKLFREKESQVIQEKETYPEGGICH